MAICLKVLVEDFLFEVFASSATSVDLCKFIESARLFDFQESKSYLEMFIQKRCIEVRTIILIYLLIYSRHLELLIDGMI